MTSICIGGCCVPYSAIFPVLMVALKWVMDQLKKVGLFGGSKAGGCCDKDGICSVGGEKDETKEGAGCGNGCCDNAKKGSVKAGDRKSPVDNFLPIESMEEWNSITSKSSKTNSPIVVDFTASWCKPCKKIAPFFEGLSKEYDGFFVKVDVDEMDELAEKAKVSMMPTFAVYMGEEQMEKTAGANEGKLKDMVEKHLSKVVE